MSLPILSVLAFLLPRVLASQCVNDNGLTDSGGDPCSFYEDVPQYCGCCDTLAFLASDCCACQQSPEGSATWWSSVFHTWPRKATAIRLPGKGIQTSLPEDIAERWPALLQIDLSGNQLTGGLPPGLGNLSNLSDLDLHDNQLNGHLPAELGKLSALEELDLSANQFSGALPLGLGNLTSLRTLKLQSNQLSGSIPPELGGLANLQSLSLRSNDLSGSLPRELGRLRSLRELILYGNRLQGGLPAELGNLTSLRKLSLFNNRLSGSIPPELGRLADLQTLWLNRNRLTGGLPAELGGLASLRSLSLRSNDLSGSLPRELGRLSSLQELYLYSNRLQGGLPPELGDMTSLEVLEIHDNRLRGSLPAELGQLRSLRELSAGSNQLSGTLPAKLGDLASLETLSLESNRFRGKLPQELGKLRSLTRLLLQENNLWGSLPAELGNLASLQHISLRDNRFTGVLPPELGNLARLQEMDLYNNLLSGSLPPELGNLTSLQTLKVGTNQLSGSLPPELGRLASLQTLWLSRNQLTGDLPAELGRLASLRSLSLHSNDLSGSLPPELGNLTSLQEVWLGGNHLTGALPAELGGLSALQTLSIIRNDLSGPLPPQLGKLTNLQLLTASNNQLSGVLPLELGNLRQLRRMWLHGNRLSGPIPPELGRLTSMQLLFLHTNQLSGALPAELGNLTSLQQLSLHTNTLSGGLPPELGELTSLRELQLYDNRLQGALPQELSKLTSLQQLELNRNQLSGSLPPELGQLTSLRRLWLDQNQLSGTVPAELGRLTSLESLSLHSNNLSGTIPQDLGNLTALQELYLHSNELSGALPAELGNLRSLRTLELTFNHLSGAVPAELGKLTSLQSLFLRFNSLGGSLPSELGNLLNLQRLCLRHNSFEGVLPPELGQLTRLEELELDRNQLSGGLPPELGKLTSLRTLHLHRNQLNGSLPARLGNLMALEELYLYNNQLSGDLPAELGNLTSLRALLLSDNRLSGGIPPEFGRLGSLQILRLEDNQLSGALPTELGGASSPQTGFRGLLNLQDLRASRNPLLCGGAEVVAKLVSLTRLDLRACCFQDFAGLPTSLEHLDLGENLLTEVPMAWREQTPVPLSLKSLWLDGNRITEWDTSAVVPPEEFVAGAWQCGSRPAGLQLPWRQLGILDVSRNPLNTSVFYFLGSLSHLDQLRTLHARDAGLLGDLPALAYDFVPYVPLRGGPNCTNAPSVLPGFLALLTLDLSGNGITAVLATPPPKLVEADLSRNRLTAMDSRWWLGGTQYSLSSVDATRNAGLQLPVLLEASGTCPGLGATYLIANARGWDGNGTVECTTLCPMARIRFLVDTTVNESVLCRCTEGQGMGQTCSSCPDDTFSTMSFTRGKYSRTCQACPANSQLRDKAGACFADCMCSAGFYMTQISDDGSTQDVGTTPCDRLPPEGACLSCGLFRTSAPGSRRASDCFCNGDQSRGGWEGLLQRQGQCGCPVGFHMNFQERRCTRCQLEEDCSDWTRSLEPPTVNPGFWALPAPPKGSDGLFGNFSGHSIWRCQSTVACPGNSSCGEGHMGTACSLCGQGLFRTPSGSCVPCSRPYMESRLLLLAALLASVVFPILAHIKLQVDMGEPHGLALAFRAVWTSLGQIVQFGQIMGLVWLFGVEWPPVADSVFTGSQAFSLDFAGWLGVACLDAQQQESMPLMVGFRWMLPLAGVVVTCLAALLVNALGCILGRLSAHSCKQREARIRRLLTFRSLDVLRVLVFFLQLFFPSLLKNALLPLTCAEAPNGLLTMKAYPHVVCWDKGFSVVAGVGIVQSALLSLGFPLLLFFAWKRIDASRTLDVLEQRRRWWAFIFVAFRPQKISWVLVAKCKDIALNLITAALPGLGTAQLLTASVISILHACLALRVSPYPDMSNTVLEVCTASAVAALCLFTAGVGFQSEPDIPNLEVTIAGGRGSAGYAQRAISLVLLQGLSLVCPVAILVFQVLGAFPRCRHLIPASLRPLSEEQREEWSQRFSRAMGVEEGPLKSALAELDSVDFATFRQAAITGQLTWRTLTMRKTEAQPSEVDLHARIAALRAENAALSAQNAVLVLENARLHSQAAVPCSSDDIHAGTQADADDREELLQEEEIEQQPWPQSSEGTRSNFGYQLDSVRGVQPELLGRDIRSL